MPKQIFVSHAQENSVLARAIATRLERARYTTWYYERDGLPGGSHLEQSFDAIAGSSAVLVLISPSSIASHEVDVEFGWAHGCANPLFPVMMDLTCDDLARGKKAWAMMVGATVRAAAAPNEA